MITVKGITKKYGKKDILKGVDFEFPNGKMVAFIGSNGAGKSTLLSIITRTIQKNSGDILVDNKNLDDWKNYDIAKKLSILSQSNHSNVRVTVKELVSFGRFPHSKGNLKGEDHKKIEEAINYVGIGDFSEKYIDELSGGQRQMAYIAMVIAQDTEYIFLDEPLNNLDMKHSVQIMNILKKLVAEEKKTIMIVIHDINFVSCYADYIVAMKDGKIIKGGKTEDMMNSQVLKEIYNMNIEVKEIMNQRICLYYL